MWDPTSNYFLKTHELEKRAGDRVRDKKWQECIWLLFVFRFRLFFSSRDFIAFFCLSLSKILFVVLLLLFFCSMLLFSSRCCEYVAHFFSSGYMRRFFAPISVFSRLFLVCSIDSDVYVCISLVNVNFMLLFKLNILPYVCFPFYCHALSHLSLIETVMFTLYSTINGG